MRLHSRTADAHAGIVGVTDDMTDDPAVRVALAIKPQSLWSGDAENMVRGKKLK